MGQGTQRVAPNFGRAWTPRDAPARARVRVRASWWDDRASLGYFGILHTLPLLAIRSEHRVVANQAGVSAIHTGPGLDRASVRPSKPLDPMRCTF
jgi:hypothetical protein